MKKIKLTITISNTTRRIEYIVIEGRKLPISFFYFKNGEWVAEQENFPVGNDNDIDILIIVAGNHKSQSKMKVYVDNNLKGNYEMYKPFNKNGYGLFNEEVQ